MPKYFYQITFAGDGVKGLVRDGGTAQCNAIEKSFRSAGGRIEALYYTFGATDLIIVADLPDAGRATAMSLTIVASGGFNVKTMVLMTAEEVDAAARKNITYSPLE